MQFKRRHTHHIKEKIKIKILLNSVAFILIFAANVFAQTVVGTVRDSANAVVVGADIRLFTTQNFLLQSTTTDSNGKFRLENIANGSYLIEISKPGFAVQKKPLKIFSNIVTVDFVLEINPTIATVTVTAETNIANDRNNVPAEINIINSDSISQRTSAVLAQIANEESGVSLQRTSPTIGAVLVRGLTEVAVYLDGVRYTNSTQRGGINTFFNLNDPSSFQSVEIQRSPNTAQFGSDGLGGNVQLISRQPLYGIEKPIWSGEFNSFFGSADRSFGGNFLIGYGSKSFGFLANVNSRRVNNLRPGGGLDSHSAITRFLGLPSNIIGSERLPDTAFTQYGGNFQINFLPTENQQFIFRYQRSQQDGGKRYDQLLGGDGNLIADLKNLMLDFLYLRYARQGFGFFDSFSATFSYNSQREERINQGDNGNPFATITNDKERTSTWGFSFFLDKQFRRNTLLLGGDFYRDFVNAPSFQTEPAANNRVTLVRPRVPNGARYDLFGLYVQEAFEAIPNRLRVSGALRYNIGIYRSRAADAPVFNGQPLFPDDSARFNDFSGRIGVVLTIFEGLNAAFNYSRGFRAPNITSLGSLGLVGAGFQVSATSVAGLNAKIGTTADASAVSTGIPVLPLKSEVTNNFEGNLRFRNRRFESNFTAFLTDYKDIIVRQTLILPPGAVGLSLGGNVIVSQNQNGAVFVALSNNPVLIQTNLNDSRLYGIEFSADFRINSEWKLGGNISTLYAEDSSTGLPPNLGGGGIPPTLGFMRIRYEPFKKRFWIEFSANFAGRQDRLSSLDLADRRTGGARSRAGIQNFFRGGACVRGITTVGANGKCNSPGGILIATGETLSQVQNRLLPIGATINGVFIANDSTAVPLFTSISGYSLFNLRSGFLIGEKHRINLALENILDKSHRLPGWGIDGAGRSLRISYRFSF